MIPFPLTFASSLCASSLSPLRAFFLPFSFFQISILSLFSLAFRVRFCPPSTMLAGKRSGERAHTKSSDVLFRVQKRLHVLSPFDFDVDFRRR